VPPGTTTQVAQLLVQGVELEAHHQVIREDGRLEFFAELPAPNAEAAPTAEAYPLIIAYGPGVWRSVAAVGAYTEATKPLPKETPGENPGRREAGR
jgi:hypothetical protein